VKKNNIEKELEKAQQLVNSTSGAKQSVVSESAKGLGIILVQNYMWDQTNQVVKIYIEVDKEQKIEDNQLSLKIGPDSKSVTCVFGKYRFTLARLYKDVDEAKSTVKITKSNRVIITLHKIVSENWPSLNVQDSSFKSPLTDNKDADPSEIDPSAGLMKLMKNMYAEGDDEMKRTIAKSWYESQNKSPGAGLGLDLPEL